MYHFVNIKMLDLFALAQANAASIEEEFGSLISSKSTEESKRLHEFADFILKAGLISINVRLHVLVELVSGRVHQNTYELAEELSQLSGRSATEILQERLQDYFDKRKNFDSAFSNGEQFRYGALYAGGVALTAYGPYCIVLDRGYQESLTHVCALTAPLLTLARHDRRGKRFHLRRILGPSP